MVPVLMVFNLSLSDIVSVILRDMRTIINKAYTVKPSLKSVKRLISLGRYKDAIRLMNSSGVHAITPEVIQLLKQKHPETMYIHLWILPIFHLNG
jgi:flagellar biosynthesis/type III secretory pathway ATPase